MPSPEPLSPLSIFELLSGHQRSGALKAAIELGLFTAVGGGFATPAAIAGATQASERGIRILCDFMVTVGMLAKAGDSYSLTPESAAFLDKRSPAYLGSVADMLTGPTLVDSYLKVASAVRKGGTTISAEGTMDPEHPVWITFARGMMPMMMPAAQAIAALLVESGAQPSAVLDIAASHGIFGISVAQRFPAAMITALDWAPVLEVSRENAAAFGVADRYRTIAGSAFDVDFEGPYDIVLVPNFYHHFDAPTCTRLAAKIRESLTPSGAMVTLEFVPNDDRISPPIPAQFALTMLASTSHGDAYTFAEFERMFQTAGFSRNVFHPLPHLPQSVIVSQA